MPKPEPHRGPDALTAFVRQHQGWVWRYLRFLGSDAATADDLTQETFVAVLRRHEHIEPRAQRTYLRRTAHSLFLRAARLRRVTPLVEEPAAEVAFDLFSGSDDGDGYLQALRECVALLEPRQRQALDGLYREGIPRRDLAARLGLSEGGIKSLLHRTYSRLRHCVERRLV
ncbi:MAG: sigma-70 family RNA polymerase sigma factor [Planctomycetota bacterium]